MAKRLGRSWRAVGLVALALTGSTQAADLYRYTNAEGRVEISSSVPNERVAFGYEVLDGQTGRVIRSVAPQMSPEEYAIKQEQERCRSTLARLEKLYQSEDDIRHAEATALASIDNRIANARASIAHLTAQRADLQGQAARLERSGKTPPEKLVSSIEKAANQIQTLDAEIEQREEDREAAKARFQDHMRMFRDQDCLVVSSR